MPALAIASTGQPGWEAGALMLSGVGEVCNSSEPGEIPPQRPPSASLEDRCHQPLLPQPLLPQPLLPQTPVHSPGALGFQHLQLASFRALGLVQFAQFPVRRTTFPVRRTTGTGVVRMVATQMVTRDTDGDT